jgi:XapX domain-containing protein
MVSAAVGLCLGLPIGAGRRWFDIPSSAPPPVVVGALLVMAMTIGYVLVDRYAATHPAQHEADCGGSSGLSHSAMHRQDAGGGGS